MRYCIDMSKFITTRNFPGGNASTTQPGLIQIATQAEVDAGVVPDKAVVPLTLNSYITTPQGASQATTLLNGTVELATNAEAIAGVLTTHAVTPAGLNAALAGAGLLFGGSFASTTVAGPLLNGTTVFATAATLVTPVLAAGTYAYIVSFQMRHTNTNRSVRAQLTETANGVIETYDESTHQTVGSVAHPVHWSGTLVLGAGATTFTLDYSRATHNQPGAASSAEIKNIRMMFFQVA